MARGGLNGDSGITLDDFDAFLAVYEGGTHDCDGGGELDLLGMLLDPALDGDATGIPDVCEASGDLNGDGEVTTVDLLLLLAAWGPCPPSPDPCPADLEADGTVSIIDLLILLGNWG